MSETADVEAPSVPAATSVLISGGSRGLGLALVVDLLERGVRVATFARTAAPQWRQLEREHGDRLFAAAVDATDAGAVVAFVDAACERLGPIDGLVSNAAIGQDALLAHTAPEDVATIVATNLIGPILLLRLFARRLLLARRPGRAVSITSVVARRAYPGLAAYAATKAGLEAATLVLAQEARGRILANCVAPGFFDSDMSSVLGARQRAAVARRTATGRLMRPAHVVPVVRMLLLEDVEMNGQVVVVDGGSRA